VPEPKVGKYSPVVESGPGDGEEFRELFEALSTATEALKRSHDELLARVAELEAELARKNRALERKHRLEALGKLAAGVAHEIRNPLGSLSLYLDLLESEVEGRREALALIERMRQAVEHLSNTVTDILTFTEPGEARAVTYTPSEVLEEALALATAQLNGSVRVERSCPPQERTAVGDPDWIRRVLLNLIRNACEAMPQGGILQAAVRYEPEHVVFTIRDSGSGIPEEDIDKVFLPFWGKREGGTGMGLSIVHSLVERHGGSVELANHPEGGLQATVRLPWSVPCKAQKGNGGTSKLGRSAENT